MRKLIPVVGALLAGVVSIIPVVGPILAAVLA
jgi:predicted PurR-regulated permease PerM